MINISNLSIQFGGKFLFDNVSFTIKPNDRIGLIGRNGSGKSTILKIIYGLQESENGTVSKPNDYTMGYLPQECVIESNRTVFDEAAESLSEIKELELKIQELTDEISERNDYDSKSYIKLLHNLSDSNDRYNYLGGHSIEAEVEKVLKGLGFTQNDFKRNVAEFSGGWQMRIELTKILLVKPNCILLDEPTNHLDIESIQWLENFLKNYKGSIVVVSHDRAFLNAISNRTIELSLGKIYDFNLPYSKFIVQREQIKEQQQKTYDNQQRQIAQTERFIERFRSKATLATRVQSRIKMLEKVDRVEVEIEDHSVINFKFPDAPRSGKIVVDIKNLDKRFGNNRVLNSINFNLERGERVAYVGKNGEGKTTLAKIIAGEASYEGVMNIGSNVKIGYYAQQQAEMLDSQATVFDIIERAATGDMRSQIRNLLGAFLFSGDSIYKKVKVLSGGEKSRLAIARLLLQPVNLLILDEPTNHLDMLAKDVLKNALINYKGTLIIVSHDRSFLSGLTEKIYFFKEKKVIEYPGDINYFIEKQRIDSLHDLEKNINNDIYAEKVNGKSQSQLHRETKKNYQREKSRIKKLIDKCEKEIEDYELTKSEYENEFSKPGFFSKPEAQSIQEKYDKILELLEHKEEQWVSLQSELDNFSKDNAKFNN